MATTFRIKRFSAGTDAMKKVAEDTYYRELKPAGEKLGGTIKREAKNAGRWIAKNPVKSAGIAGGVALTGMAVAGGVKGYKKSKEKQYSDDKGMSTGKKLLLGTAALAGGVAAAKTGMLGKSAQLGINKAQFGLGKAVGSKGLMKNAVQGQREALGKVKIPRVTQTTPKALPEPQKLLTA